MYTRTLFRPIHEALVHKRQMVRTVAVASKAVSKEYSNLKSWKEIPGPSALPLIGSLLHHLPGGSLYNLNGSDLTQTLYNTYGPLVRLEHAAGMNPFIFVFDPDIAEQILRSEDRMPIRIGLRTLDYYAHNLKKGKPDDPTGLFTAQGEPWKKSRSAMNPIMLQPETVKLYAQPMNEITMDLIQRIKTGRDEDNMMKNHIANEIYLWATENIGQVAVGGRIGSLDPNLPEDAPAKRLIKCIHELLNLTEELDLKPSLWEYIATPKYKKCMECYKEQEELSKYFISKAKKNIAKYAKSEQGKSILEKLLNIDERLAHVMATEMLFAGVDTMANTSLATLYFLASNEDKQIKLREELKMNPETRYLKACVKESLRMLPVIPGNLRNTTKDYNINGYHIPPNFSMLFVHQDMSRMGKYFPRPTEYIPERWLVDNSDPMCYRNAHPFAYNPFGYGIRSCIGRRLAYLGTETFVTRMLENFHVSWHGPTPKVWQATVNYIKGPHYFVFKSIDN